MSKKQNKEWVPIKDVMEIIYHPDFYWGQINNDVKYINIVIDTRDNCCLVKDRNGKVLDLEKLKIAIQNIPPTGKGMNENKLKYTPAQVEEAFEILRDFVKGELPQDSRAACFLDSVDGYKRD